MFNGDIPRVLLRRWYLVVLGLVATAGLVLLALKVVAPTYSLTAEVVMLPPETAVVTGDNPFLNLAGLESMGDVTSKAVTDDRTKLEVQERFGEVDYGVGLDHSAAAPIVVISTESTNAASTRAVMDFIAVRFKDTLRSVQSDSGVPPDAYITMKGVTQMTRPKVEHKSQMRAALVAGAAGLMMTLLFTAAVDAALRARSRRRSRPGDGSESQTTGPGEAAESPESPESHVSPESHESAEPLTPSPRTEASEAGPERTGARRVGAGTGSSPRAPR